MSYKTRNGEDGATCLECGKAIYGRQDKRFCNTTCKNSFHNRSRNVLRAQKTRTMESLKRNYEILSIVLGSGRSSISMEALEVMGFDGSTMTGLRKDSHGHSEFSCFDIIYCKTEMKVFNIRREGGAPSRGK